MIPEGFVPLECFNIRKGKYYINREGDIYGVYRQKLMKTHADKDGYRIISLFTNDLKEKKFKLHRLMMQTFHPIPDPENFTVNHMDGNNKNNSLENFEWLPGPENSTHASKLGLYKHGEENPSAVFTNEFVAHVCEAMENKFFTRDISRYLFENYGYVIINYSSLAELIYGIRRKKIWKHVSKKYNILEKNRKKSVGSSTTIESPIFIEINLD